MTTIVCSSQHPVLSFARKEWETLSAEYAQLWPVTANVKTVVIGTWEEIMGQGIGEQLQAELDKRLTTPVQSSYWLQLSEEQLIISGQTEHSTLYAVYEAFKQYAGLQWIYPGVAPAISEPAAADKIVNMGKLYEPWFERRGFVIENYYDPEYILQMIDWCAKNRINEIFFTYMLWEKIREVAASEIEKRGMELTLGGHSMKFFLNRQETDQLHLADHPYHAKKQLDYADTSWQTPFFDQVADYCRSIPQLSRISLWPEDLPAGDNNEFLALYISFVERLQEHLRQTMPQLQFEHIAYNAGLAWNMLERGDTAASSKADILLAYWGRDYRYAFNSSLNRNDLRAEAAIKDWAYTARSNNRKLAIFEYYSDHFMYSALFPSIPSTIIDDAAYYYKLGVQGMTNLIVPCPGYPDYDWKWAAGFNSYVFSRAVWGDTKEQILHDYYIYYPAVDRPLAKQWMETIEQAVTAVTAWNAPLFPGRVVDIRKFRDNEEHHDEVIELLQRIIDQLSEVYSQASDSMKHSAAGANMQHLIAHSETCLRAWSEKQQQ